MITKNSYEMGPGLQQEDDRRHDESAGCAVAAPAKISAAAARAEEYSALAAGSVGALATIYAALAVQAAEGQEGQLTGPEALSKAAVYRGVLANTETAEAVAYRVTAETAAEAAQVQFFEGTDRPLVSANQAEDRCRESSVW